MELVITQPYILPGRTVLDWFLVQIRLSHASANYGIIFLEGGDLWLPFAYLHYPFVCSGTNYCRHVLGQFLTHTPCAFLMPLCAGRWAYGPLPLPFQLQSLTSSPTLHFIPPFVFLHCVPFLFLVHSSSEHPPFPESFYLTSFVSSRSTVSGFS